jgi:hypothetical protein
MKSIHIFFIPLLAILATTSPAKLVNIHRVMSPSNKTAVPSAVDLINKGVAALGGEETINKIRGLTYHVPEYATGLSFYEPK